MDAIPVFESWGKTAPSIRIELDETAVCGPVTKRLKLDCGHELPLVANQRFAGVMPVLRVTMRRAGVELLEVQSTQ